MEKKTMSVAGQVIGAIVYVIGVWLVMAGLFKLIDLYADRVCSWCSKTNARLLVFVKHVLRHVVKLGYTQQ